MRVVVDTNVFVSAALKDKSFPAIALHVVGQHGTLLKSVGTEQQLFQVIARPRIAALIEPASIAWMRELLERIFSVVGDNIQSEAGVAIACPSRRRTRQPHVDAAGRVYPLEQHAVRGNRHFVS